MMKLTSPDLVLDCGASGGAFTRLCREAGYSGPIWCFDPNTRCVEVLHGLARDDSRIRVFAHGTGDAETQAILHVAGEDGNFGSLLEQEPWLTDRFRSAYVRDEYTVPIRRLDAVLAEEGIPTSARLFLKMDTQGYDLPTMDGLGDRMKQVVAVKSECAVQTIYKHAPTHWALLDRLRPLGFEPCFFSTISRDFDGRLIEYDAYFLRWQPMRERSESSEPSEPATSHYPT